MNVIQEEGGAGQRGICEKRIWRGKEEFAKREYGGAKRNL